MSGFKMIRNDFEKRMNGMINSGGLFRGFLNSTIYSIYQKAQDERFRSENQSEGRKWKQVRRDYRIRKIREKQRDPNRFPGGDRILIHTGELSRSVVGSDLKFHRKIVSERSITIATTLEYAGFVAETRPFMSFGRTTQKKFSDAVKRFVKNKIGGKGTLRKTYGITE